MGRPRDPSSALRLGRVVRITGTLLLVLLLVHLVDMQAVGRVLLGAHPALLAAAVGVALADRALMVGKWYPLLRAQAPSIPLWDAVRAYLAAGSAAMLLPASIGGDVLRAVALGRGRQAVIEIGTSIAMERVLGFLGSGLIILCGLWVAMGETSVDLLFLLPWVLGSIAAIAALGLAIANGALLDAVRRWLSRRPEGRWAKPLQRLEASVRLYRGRPITIAVVGLLSVLEQLFPVLVLWILARALGTPADFAALFVAVPLTVFVSRLPIVFAGIGVFEGGLVYLLGLFGVPAAEALALAVAARGTELIALLPGFLLWESLTSSGGARAAETASAPDALIGIPRSPD